MRYRVLLRYKDPGFHPAYFYRYLPALRWYQRVVKRSDALFQYRENGQWVTCPPGKAREEGKCKW